MYKLYIQCVTISFSFEFRAFLRATLRILNFVTLYALIRTTISVYIYKHKSFYIGHVQVFSYFSFFLLLIPAAGQLWRDLSVASSVSHGSAT